MKISDIKARYNPFVDLFWVGLDGPVSRSQVHDADPLDGAEPYTGGLWSKAQHAARIRYLAVHGWDDPIIIDWSQEIPVTDGNHRLAAALWRGDDQISVLITPSEPA